MGGALARGPAAPVVVKLVAGEGARADGIDAIALSCDGALVATGGAGHAINIWDAATGALARRLVGHGGAVAALAFAGNDGKRLASGAFDDTARVWDVAEGACARVCAGHGAGVSSVAWSRDGSLLLSGSRDRTARAWYLSAGAASASAILAGHGESVTCGAVRGDGAACATGSRDATARVWDLGPGGGRGGDAVRGVLRFSLEGHGAAVYGVAWTPDGALLATGSEDATARLWDAGTGDGLRKFEGHRRTVRCVAFSPCSMFLLTGSYDRALRVWRTSGEEVAPPLRGHGGKVLYCALSDSTARSGSRDGTCRAWDVASALRPL